MKILDYEVRLHQTQVLEIVEKIKGQYPEVYQHIFHEGRNSVDNETCNNCDQRYDHCQCMDYPDTEDY